ncbi:uncharacterized protein LOC135331434 [Halichondria panicea]|uniref:uncharacterized protein LOC135331434 n=1 Tax=Halichondria panicea TaxID=6063 RepID=UPI00312B4F6D
MGYLSLLVVATLLAVGAYACQPPDCDHPDCGSCANACCSIDFMFEKGPDDVFNTLMDSLKKGGADGRYKFVNSTDYRKDNISVQYQLQGIHSTLVHHYNDTLDFLVEKADTKAVLKAFSISRIEGAYCDAGQNYKNLVGLVKGLDLMFEQKKMYGCSGKPEKTG